MRRSSPLPSRLQSLLRNLRPPLLAQVHLHNPRPLKEVALPSTSTYPQGADELEKKVRNLNKKIRQILDLKVFPSLLKSHPRKSKLLEKFYKLTRYIYVWRSNLQLDKIKTLPEVQAELRAAEEAFKKASK